eukprot:4533982-Pyramimonas_sp.AAC.1
MAGQGATTRRTGGWSPRCTSRRGVLICRPSASRRPAASLLQNRRPIWWRGCDAGPSQQWDSSLTDATPPSKWRADRRRRPRAARSAAEAARLWRAGERAASA